MALSRERVSLAGRKSHLVFRGAIAAWAAEPRTTRGGQPRCSALAIATALALRAVFRQALRRTEGLIGSIPALLGLDLAVPDHRRRTRRSSPSRWSGAP